MSRLLSHARLRARNLSYVVRGYRYARRLPEPDAVASQQHQKGALERYFDGHTEGHGIWKWRHYFDVYERHLSRFVGREFHLVEVGVFSGGSLPMWREYFGPECRIYGVDIEPACRVYEQDGVRVLIGDQSDPDFWARFREQVPVVDVLIDDGGHEPHQQIATLEAMLPHLQPGGVYVCEDVHGAFQPFHSFIDGLCRPLSAIATSVATDANALQQQVGSVHRYPLMTVIEKPLTAVRRFEAPRHGTQWQPFL